VSRAARQRFGDIEDLAVLVKPESAPGALYRSQHKFVLIHAAAKCDPRDLLHKKRARWRTNVWQSAHSGARQDGVTRDEGADEFLIAIISEILCDCTKRSDIMLDPFARSHAGLIAAEQTGRLARLITSDPSVCSGIIRQWQRVTGRTAQLARSGRSTGEAFVESDGGADYGEADRR
jgi:DNA modification methylase